MTVISLVKMFDWKFKSSELSLTLWSGEATHLFGFYVNYIFYNYIKIIIIVEMLTRQKNEAYSFYKGKNNQIIEKMRRTNGRKRDWKSTLEITA